MCNGKHMAWKESREAGSGKIKAETKRPLVGLFYRLKLNCLRPTVLFEYLSGASASKLIYQYEYLLTTYVVNCCL